MSNSGLVDLILLSPNYDPREDDIRKITIHHMAGNMTARSCGELFQKPAKAASSNYGIGRDAKVGMYVEEKNRSWCSSSPENDHQAITIEVANDQIGGDWHVSDKVLAKLIDLCVDICQRNHIKRLNFTGDTSGNLTMHKWFAATACPGPYLESKFPYIAEEVNQRLSVAEEKTSDNQSDPIQEKDVVSITDGAVYYNGKSIPAWVRKKNWIVEKIQGDRAVINRSEDGKNAINSPIHVKYLRAVGQKKITVKKETSFTVKVTADALNIRAGAGTNYKSVGMIRNHGIYTITETKSGTGAKAGWGKLKSGAGWISLDYVKKL